MTPAALAVSLAVLAWGGDPAKTPPKVDCLALPDPQAHVRPVFDALIAGLRERRRVRMSAQLVYVPTLVGPAYGGGDTPALSTAPRGVVWIGPEFLPYCNDPHSMALVLSHELAHIYLGHGQVRIQRWLDWMGARRTSMNQRSQRRTRAWRERNRDEIARHEQVYGPTPGGASGYGQFQLENASFLRGQEEAADEMGTVIAGQAGFNPTLGLNWYHSFGHLWPGFNIRDPLSSHPSFPDRIASISYWADRHFPHMSAMLPSAPASP